MMSQTQGYKMQESRMNEISVDVVVIGGGPGGYPCAFRAADLGLSVVLVDKRSELGGVCLHEGCIPSKAWLNVVKLIQEIKEYQSLGLIKPCDVAMDVPKMYSWMREKVTAKLASGLRYLAGKRKVHVLEGSGFLQDKKTVRVTGVDGSVTLVQAKTIVIATGSRPVRFADMPVDPRILDSTSALELNNPSGKMLVVGSGIIGCELSGVFAAMGLDVSVCDMHHTIMPGVDEELSLIVQRSLEKQGVRFSFSSAYDSIEIGREKIKVHLKCMGGRKTLEVDWVLVAVGRVPNTENLGLEALGIALNPQGGFVAINDRFQTSVSNIYAIGDVAGGHLAHEATAQGRLCAEVISGLKRQFDVRAMPAVAYTYPELAWVGETEASLRAKGVKFLVQSVSWKANGRANATLQEEGVTKLFADESGRLLGGAVVGVGAGDLIAELSLALEMGANIDDVALTVRAHPTTSETIGLAAEILEGCATDQ